MPCQVKKTKKIKIKMSMKECGGRRLIVEFEKSVAQMGTQIFKKWKKNMELKKVVLVKAIPLIVR